MENSLFVLIGGALLFMGASGLALGLIIGWVAKKFAVPADEKVETVLALLPGANCGGCGFAGCADFAKALAAGNAEPSGCPVCSNTVCGAIADVLGLSAGNGHEANVAVIFCGGSNTNAVQGAKYNGISDCKSAILVSSGAKGCPSGCLGYGSCARSCPFGAIEVVDGLAKVHPHLCIGCGKCVQSCPRKIIRLVPERVKVHVYCSSKDKGPVKRSYCKVACLGCRKCGRTAAEGQFEFEGFLAKVNPANPPAPEVVAQTQCPGHCLGLSHGFSLPEKTQENTP